MENKVAITCKATAIIIFILTFFATIISGNLGEGNYASGVAITVLISTLTSTFISSLLIYALGEIIELLHNIRKNTYELHDLNRREIRKKEKGENQSTIGYAAPRTYSFEKTSEGSWICKECKAENSTQAIHCKDCGKYR